MEDSFDRPLPKLEQGLAQITKLQGDEANLGFNLERPTQEFEFDPRVLPLDPDTQKIHPRWGEPETQPQLIETQAIESNRIEEVIEKADSLLADLLSYSRQEVKRLAPQIGQFVANNRLHLAAAASAVAIVGMAGAQAGEVVNPPSSLYQPIESLLAAEKMQGSEEVSEILEVINHEQNPDLEVYRALLKVDPEFQKKHFKGMQAYTSTNHSDALLYGLPPGSYTLSLPDGTRIKVYGQGNSLTVSWQARPSGQLSAEEWMADAEEQKRLVQHSTSLKPSNISFSKDPDNPVAMGDVFLKDTGGRLLTGRVEVDPRSQVVLKLKEQNNELGSTASNSDQSTAQTKPNG